MNNDIATSNSNKGIKNINLMKFILGSGFGIFMFLIPISYNGSFSTCIGIVTDFISEKLVNVLPYFVVGTLSLSAILSTIEYTIKPKFITENETMRKLFKTTPLYIASKIIAAIISIMVVVEIGPDAIISGATGGTMMGLGATLIAIAISLSYVLPFLTDCGIMEFLGVILKPVVRPLFKVPGRASVDLITSWFGAANAAVILSREQYMGGYYTARETSTIMTNFSLVSIPFCLVISGALGLNNMFPAFYLTTCAVGLLLAVIIPRIAPLKNIPDTYNENVGKNINEEVPEGYTNMQWALEEACRKAGELKFNKIIKSGNDIVLGIIFNLIPTVVAWGTIGLVLVEFTPIFQWISYPMGMFLQVLGVEYAFEVAPATLVGFADMFIPALLVAGVESIKTKFIIGVLSLVQIVYMTEVGAIIIQSEVPLDLKKLFIIFLERTIIALPIIVLIANIII